MDINWINITEKTTNYLEQALAEQGTMSSGQLIARYLNRFKQEHKIVDDGQDRGGLIVFNGGDVVYDYENFCGWVRG